ncbi:MAG: pyridoxamine 5'-phosphate oxidase family protein [Bacteroidales bacterium]|jgi:uncharacterized pyridoxamine 5'-phosphate oxidase family protein|nr:pyridoxamine 5'-phosphate oxidase family protein [Bacteroidales bacterium]
MKKIILLAIAFSLSLVAFSQNSLLDVKKRPSISQRDNGMKTVFEFLEKCQTYYLSTVEGDKPKVRPFGTINMFKDRLYIQTGRKKLVSQQMEKNPNIEICAFNGKEWIRIEAIAVDDPSIEAKESMMKKYPSLLKMYPINDPNTQVLYLKDVKATIYSFTSEPKTFKF